MWVTEFSGSTSAGKLVEYQTLAREGFSAAERKDRVKVSGRVVHTGWASDHEGYAIYQRILQGAEVI